MSKQNIVKVAPPYAHPGQEIFKTPLAILFILTWLTVMESCIVQHASAPKLPETRVGPPPLRRKTPDNV